MLLNREKYIFFHNLCSHTHKKRPSIRSVGVPAIVCIHTIYGFNRVSCYSFTNFLKSQLWSYIMSLIHVYIYIIIASHNQIAIIISNFTPT